MRCGSAHQPRNACRFSKSDCELQPLPAGAGGVSGARSHTRARTHVYHWHAAKTVSHSDVLRAPASRTSACAAACEAFVIAAATRRQKLLDGSCCSSERNGLTQARPSPSPRCSGTPVCVARRGQLPAGSRAHIYPGTAGEAWNRTEWIQLCCGSAPAEYLKVLVTIIYSTATHSTGTSTAVQLYMIM